MENLQKTESVRSMRTKALSLRNSAPVILPHRIYKYSAITICLMNN